MKKTCAGCAYLKPLYYYIRDAKRITATPLGICCIKSVPHPRRSIFRCLVSDRTPRCRRFKEDCVPWQQQFEVLSDEVTVEELQKEDA